MEQGDHMMLLGTFFKVTPELLKPANRNSPLPFWAWLHLPVGGGGGVAAGVARLITKRRVIPSPRRPVPETFSQRRCRCHKTQKLSAASKKTKLTRLDEPGLTSIMNINETSGLISQTWDVAAVAPRLRLRRLIKRDATSENFLHLLSDLQRAHC